MDSQVLTRQSQIEITPQNTVGGEVALGASTIDLPPHIQTSLDAVLDYYADNALKPEIELSGTPLDVASNLVIKLRETVPAHLTNESKDILDFMVRELAEFCKVRAMNNLSLRFAFDGSYSGDIST